VRRGVHRFSVAITIGLLIAATYLAYWGMIGLRTWALTVEVSDYAQYKKAPTFAGG